MQPRLRCEKIDQLLDELIQVDLLSLHFEFAGITQKIIENVAQSRCLAMHQVQRPARVITPKYPRQRAAPGNGRVHQAAHRPKLIVVSALDGKCFHPMPIQSVAFVRANDQTAAG